MCAGKCGCPGLAWSLLWILILVFVGWPIGQFCAGWYVLLSPFSVCISFLECIIEILKKGLDVPKMCAEKCVAQEAVCKC